MAHFLHLNDWLNASQALCYLKLSDIEVLLPDLVRAYTTRQFEMQLNFTDPETYVLKLDNAKSYPCSLFNAQSVGQNLLRHENGELLRLLMPEPVSRNTMQRGYGSGEADQQAVEFGHFYELAVQALVNLFLAGISCRDTDGFGALLLPGAVDASVELLEVLGVARRAGPDRRGATRQGQAVTSRLRVGEDDVEVTGLEAGDQHLAFLDWGFAVDHAVAQAALAGTFDQQVALVLPEEGTHGLLTLLDQIQGQIGAAGVEHLVAALAVVDRT